MFLNDAYYSIYTDGSHYQGLGGWGFVMIGSNPETNSAYKVTGFGGAINCTNNQMEMFAAVMALSCLSPTQRDNVVVTTDSKYLYNGATEYIYKWLIDGYITSRGNPVKNIPLWKNIFKLQTRHTPEWQWVKGHSGDVYNEEADCLANEGRQSAKLYKQDGVSDITSIHNFNRIDQDGSGGLVSHTYLTAGSPNYLVEFIDA